MYYVDYHTHSHCSPDGSVPVREMAERAAALGLDELCITDHADLLDGGGKRTFSYDWGPVKRELCEARKAVKGRLRLQFGIELGEAPVSPADARAVLAGAPELDFVLGSVHNMTEARGGTDFYYLSYETPEDCFRALDDYFESLGELVKLDAWDSFAHLIYPLRYMGKAGEQAGLAPYRDRIAALLRALAQSGRSLEVNTCRGRTLEEWRPVLELYRDRGGERVTVGSDAHRPQDVGAGIPEAYELLRETGFRYLTVYRGRRPEMIRL